MGYERRKEVLHNASRGWVNYFKYADAKTALQGLDEWLRRRAVNIQVAFTISK